MDTVNVGARSIVVTVEFPLKLAKRNSITVETAGDTRFRECDDGDSVRIGFDDLEEGRKVRVKGIVRDGDYLATTVIQYVP
jgi:hypothetical protein